VRQVLGLDVGFESPDDLVLAYYVIEALGPILLDPYLFFD
jgi:hypothetical protein